MKEKSNMQFEDFYTVSVYLKKGHFGDVYRCYEKETGKELAVKIISTLTNGDNGYDAITPLKFSREAAIWRRLKHRNVVEIRRVFKSPTEHHLVMEYIKDGNLIDEIIGSTTYTERDACYYMKQLFEALVYLQTKRVIHRDIKTDNLLLKKSHNGEILKITDFGLAVRLDKGADSIQVEPNGAPIHLAPETILEKPVSYAVDLWSSGVILFTLLGGYPPFYKERPNQLYAEIITKDLRMPSPFWDNVSDYAKELILGLLDKNPKTRLTAEEALNHWWIDINTEIPKIHRKKTVEKLKEFNARRKLRGAIFSVQTIYRMQKPFDKQRLSHDGTSDRHISPDKRLFKIAEQVRRNSTAVVSKTTHQELPNERTLSKINVFFNQKSVNILIPAVKVK